MSPFPPLLMEFEKKQYIVTLIPSEDNIKKGCSVYKAKKLIQAHEMGENCSSPHPVASELQCTSMTTVRNQWF